MDKNKIIVIILVIIAIALAALIGGSFIKSSNHETIYSNAIEGIGTFNSTNVTHFTLDSSNDVQTDYVGNDSKAQISIISNSSGNLTDSEAKKLDGFAKGHIIYKTAANMGEFKGEVRYFSILNDNDKGRYIMVSTGSHDLTGMIADSFKFL